MNSGKDGKFDRNASILFIKNHNEGLLKAKEDQLNRDIHDDLAELNPADKPKKHVSMENSMSTSDSSSDDNDKNWYGLIPTT